MNPAEKNKAIDAIAEYIYKSLNTPAARRTRFMAYYRSFGPRYHFQHQAYGGHTLAFRGCQLRVL